ncbi:ImmA/IrrE family metallo-endopeptidase [bacterium]|nr:ImmA/IrrE family metallo-endopeptidase [bacterium]MBU1636421.1 ImmA/IrrE family metallo-endopeptidase [bacterium]
MNRVEINNDVLRWVLSRSTIPYVKLIERFPKLPEWLEGDLSPTFLQVEGLAKATLTPLGYFFLSTPPPYSLPIPHFRTFRDERGQNSSPELIETVHLMQRRQDWMKEYLNDQGAEQLRIVSSSDRADSYREVSDRIKAWLHLRDDWAAEHRNWSDALRALVEYIEASGILIVINGVVGNNNRRALDPKEFRGFVLVDDYAPLIFLNGADSKSAQMFTIAHELAHICYGSSAAFDLRDLQPAENEIEVACNAVAAEFLVSEDQMRRQWRSAPDPPSAFQHLARIFKVSEIVVARRALDLELVSRSDFFSFYNEYSSREIKKRKDSSGGNFWANQSFRIGHRFGNAIVNAVRSGQILYQDAFRLTGLRGNTFKNFMASFD